MNFLWFVCDLTWNMKIKKCRANKIPEKSFLMKDGSRHQNSWYCVCFISSLLQVILNSEKMEHKIRNTDYYYTVLTALNKEASQEPRFVQFQDRRNSGEMSADMMHRSVDGKCQHYQSNRIRSSWTVSLKKWTTLLKTEFRLDFFGNLFVDWFWLHWHYSGTTSLGHFH